MILNRILNEECIFIVTGCTFGTIKIRVDYLDFMIYKWLICSILFNFFLSSLCITMYSERSVIFSVICHQEKSVIFTIYIEHLYFKKNVLQKILPLRVACRNGYIIFSITRPCFQAADKNTNTYWSFKLFVRIKCFFLLLLFFFFTLNRSNCQVSDCFCLHSEKVVIKLYPCFSVTSKEGCFPAHFWKHTFWRLFWKRRLRLQILGYFFNVVVSEKFLFRQIKMKLDNFTNVHQSLEWTLATWKTLKAKHWNIGILTEINWVWHCRVIAHWILFRQNKIDCGKKESEWIEKCM